MTGNPNTAAWQAHALQRLSHEAPGRRPIPDRMEWTHLPGTGPASELLGDVDGRLTVELGCGTGDNVAHLVGVHGAIGIGLDAAWGQIKRARRNYGHLQGLMLTVADACASLEHTRKPFDVCYSIFGAVGLVPPLELFALIAERLSDGGVLAFSVIHPDRPGQRPHAGDAPQADWLELPDGQRARVLRYTPERGTWLHLVEKAGLVVADAVDVTDESGEPDTLIITARKT